MRKFPQYHARQIAKHVATFFEGVIWIETIGAFRFSEGRLLPPAKPTPQKRRVVTEVNRLLGSLRGPDMA